MKDGRYRVTLDDEHNQWVCTGLRSIAASKGRNPQRRQWLLDFADHLAEKRAGNPNLRRYGRTTKEEHAGSTQ